MNVTRSSATAEKQRVSCACLIEQFTEHRRIAEVVLFLHSNALIQEVLAENGV